uniref:Uncharacterized protein n=1 Tax=Rhizophora mucronata TaxID=61149 RepID=A0A2P2LAU2_RHIMU
MCHMTYGTYIYGCLTRYNLRRKWVQLCYIQLT